MAKRASSNTTKTSTRKSTTIAGATRRTSTRRKSAAANPVMSITMTHDEIARRAYEIWVRKGRPSGQDAQNWAEAERELIASNGG